MADAGRARVIVLMTMLAVMLAIASLTLPWFSATVSGTTYYEFTLTHYYDGGNSRWSEYDSVDWRFGEIGAIMASVAMFMALWGLAALVFVWAILMGERGSGWGLLLLAVSAVSVAVPTVFAAGAIEDGLATRYSSVSVSAAVVPLSGYVLALVAFAVQALAVVAHRIRSMPGRPAEGADGSGPTESRAGDLPIR